MTEIINAKVNIDLEEGITLPAVLSTYRQDFGGTDDEILLFVFRYLEEDFDYDVVSKMVQDKSVFIKYE